MRREEQRTERLVPAGEVREHPVLEHGVVAVALDAPGELRPRGVGEVLDQAVDLLRERFLAALAPAFVCFLLMGIITRAVEPQDLENTVEMAPLLTWLTVIGVVTSLVTTMVTGTVALVAWGTLHGENTSWRHLFKRLAARMPAMLGVSLISAILVFLGMFTCGILSLYFSWRYLFAPHCALIEGRSVLQSLKRSSQLTYNSFGRFLGLIAVTYLMTSPLTGAAQGLGSGTVDSWLPDWFLGLDPTVVSAIAIVIASLLLAIPGAFWGMALTAFYFDARVRHEGYDLRLWLERVQTRHPARPSEAPPVAPQGGLA